MNDTTEPRWPTCPGVAPGQTYGGALPAEAPPEGTVWVPVQRDDDTAPADLSDGDAAAIYAKAVGSPIPHGVWADDHTATPDDVYVAVPLNAITPTLIATRATQAEAQRHFHDGGKVLVSEYGREPTVTVTPITTTHDRSTITWTDLVENVNMWRNRHPDQRFYIVPTSEAEPYCNHDAPAILDGVCECGHVVDVDDSVSGLAASGCTGALEDEGGGRFRLVHLGDDCPMHETGAPHWHPVGDGQHIPTNIAAAVLTRLVSVLCDPDEDGDTDWSPDTLDNLAEVLIVNGYAEARDGDLRSTGKAEGERWPLAPVPPDKDPAGEPRPIDWADIMPIIATYDRIVRANRSTAWDTVAAVADDQTGETFGEVLDVAEHELCLSLDLPLAIENALRGAVMAYRGLLRQQVGGEAVSLKVR